MAYAPTGYMRPNLCLDCYICSFQTKKEADLGDF